MKHCLLITHLCGEGKESVAREAAERLESGLSVGRRGQRENTETFHWGGRGERMKEISGGGEADRKQSMTYKI